jgi:diadenosine tetraphosphate (Ap4A) HIT family hydrolase
MYDPNNVFAKILRGEIPCRKILETPHAVAFHDIAPRARVHALVIPRGEYADICDFAARAPESAVSGFWNAVRDAAGALGVAENFRAVANTGAKAGQAVFHFHVHIMAD